MTRPRVFILWTLVCLVGTLYGAQFTLTWTDNSTNELMFKIERAPGLSGPDTEFEEIAQVGANVTSYVDAGLPNSTSYRYRLRAWNTAGHSGYSNTAAGTTPPPVTTEQPPNAPGDNTATPNKYPQKLVNISTRMPVAGDEPVIAGFVLESASRVLIRGVGPSLSRFAVLEPLPDPRIGVFNNSGQEFVTNDDWFEADAATMQTVGAFALTVGSKDSALVLDLPAGQYTIHLTNNGGTGTALIEVYTVP